MAYKLVIQAEAILDIQNAFEWYESQQKGLGYQLIQAIEACYDKISIHPEYYSYLNIIATLMKHIGG